jgi:FkbM family methyltransferase
MKWLSLLNVLHGVKFYFRNVFSTVPDPETKYLQKLDAKFDFAIDVGAASADWTHFFLTKMNIYKLVCFEPNEYLYSATKISLLPYIFLGRVSIYKKIVSNSLEDMYLIDEEFGNKLMYRSYISSELKGTQKGKKVRTAKLSECTDLGENGVLKIDAEGSELDVMKTGDDIFYNTIGIIIFELNFSDEQYMIFNDIDSFLSNYGFKIYFFQNGKINECNISNLNERKGVNLISIKSN